MPVWWKDEKQRKRNVAFIANFFLPGLGYVYLGRRGRFEKLLLIGYVIGYVVYFAWGYSLPSLSTYDSYHLLLYYLSETGAIVISFAFAYDARSMADQQDRLVLATPTT